MHKHIKQYVFIEIKSAIFNIFIRSKLLYNLWLSACFTITKTEFQQFIDERNSNF